MIMTSKTTPSSTRQVPYHVQAAINKTTPFPHHSSISALCANKWRRLASLGLYPFSDGAVTDFDPIFAQLIHDAADNPTALLNPDAYATPFLPVGAALFAAAESAEQNNQPHQARDFFLRAAAVYRIARFPINRSPLSQQAWELGREAYLRGARYLDPSPNAEVEIPFTHADAARGDAAMQPIRANFRIPDPTALGRGKPEAGWPVLLFICGLDAYRTDHNWRTSRHLAAGFATLSVDIPGTADSPAAAGDPQSAERLFSSVLDWLSTFSHAHGLLDADKIVARGVSTGGYYAFRLAHTHAGRLSAAVAQGGGCHDMFAPEWVRAQGHMEYPFGLAEALAWKFGFRGGRDDGENVVAYAEGAKALFSLEDNGGWLDGECCRLLIVNGMEDSIFPVEDSLLVASRGRVKDVRLVEGRGHMGNPEGEEVVLEWIDSVVGFSV